MNNKENFDFQVKHGMRFQHHDKTHIERLVNTLIEALYCPKLGEGVTIVDQARIEKYEIDDSEPINWGDLKCVEVDGGNVVGDEYVVFIDEASPESCPTFCAYIEKYMKSWGWNVKVLTEW